MTSFIKKKLSNSEEDVKISTSSSHFSRHVFSICLSNLHECIMLPSHFQTKDWQTQNIGGFWEKCEDVEILTSSSEWDSFFLWNLSYVKPLFEAGFFTMKRECFYYEEGFLLWWEVFFNFRLNFYRQKKNISKVWKLKSDARDIQIYMKVRPPKVR